MAIHGLGDLLRGHPRFKGMPDDFIDAVAGCGKNVVYKAGDYLFHEGDDADDIFMIREGLVSMELDTPGRGPQTFMTETVGGVIGLSWLVPPYTWTFDARARTDIRAVAFDATCLRGKCDADPALGYAVMKQFMPVIVERLHDTRVQMLDLYRARS
jgi:CRP/FNR family transcriptional regulator, cyclic AMP receptor protein